MSLVYPQKVTLYQVGDLVEGASFNNFLDAIDGSYCSYEGGDDPTQDAVYPVRQAHYLEIVHTSDMSLGSTSGRIHRPRKLRR